MPKYNVSVPIFASVLVTVEADSKEEAIEKAEQTYYASVCHQCANEIELGEFDDRGGSEAYLIE